MKRNKTRIETSLEYYPTKPSLGQRLEKCAKKEARPFTQVDGFSGVTADSVMHPDGDTICSGRTWEPMASCPDIRLLIPADANIADVLRLLKKARKVLKRNPHYLKWPSPPSPPPQPTPFS